ncbi:MAG TPA: methyltransferase domain-containing protein [Ktedonobacteraceae bacterium]
MPTPSDANKKRSQSTYFVQDRHNKEELTWLIIQEQMLTKSMGGTLPEQDDPASFSRVLDVACGPGGWVIDTARSYPGMKLVGIDINVKIIEYAPERAKAEQVLERVEFKKMDALAGMAFEPASFDLVNMRLAVSFVRTWDWPALLSEFQRVTRDGGVIRLTEADIAEGNSSALMELNNFLKQAFYHAGNFFAFQNDGLSSQLAPLLIRHGLENVQTRAHKFVYSASTPEGQQFIKNMQPLYRTVQPFIQKWMHAPNDYNIIYQHALKEMESVNFQATWNFVTAWGTNVEHREEMLLEACDIDTIPYQE